MKKEVFVGGYGFKFALLSCLMALGIGGASGQQLAVSPGTVTTIAGVVGTTTPGSATYSGPATSGSLLFLTGDSATKVAVDASGNIYYADRYFNVIRKLTPAVAPGTGSNPYGATTTYNMTTIVGSAPAACTGTANAPAGIESLAYGDGCVATAATLGIPNSSFSPFSVALNSAGTILFISDLSHGTIRAVNVSSATQTWGSVTLTAGDIYTVAGTGARTVPTDTETGASVATSDPIDGAHGVWVDASGNLIVSDSSALTVRKVTPGTSNIFTTIVGGNTTTASPVTVGTGTACTTTALAYGSNPCGDGETAAPPTAAITNASVQLNAAEYAMEDAAGNIYITDATDYRIRLVNTQATGGTFFGVPIAAGNIGTIVGKGVFGAIGDGGNAAENATYPTTSAEVATPNQMALDAGGSLYFTDAGTAESEARRVDPGGTIYDVAGHAGITTNCSTTTDTIGDGCPATNATLSAPTGMAVDKYGNIVIVDAQHFVVRQVNVSTTTVTYAAQAAGTTSAAQTLTIYNTSATTLNITGISVTGNFSQSAGTGSCTATTSLAGGKSCLLNIVFSPGSLGTLPGSVTLASNATNALTINLTGTGSLAASTTTETITPNPAGSGQTITFKATVTGVSAVPTGSVTFAGGTFSSGAVTLAGSGNAATATYTTSSLAPNTYPVIATYGGDVNYNGSASGATSLVVSSLAITSTLLNSSSVTPTLGHSITLTATVAGGTAPLTGTVNFLSGSNSIGSASLAGTTASITTTDLFLGANNLSAFYSGNASNLYSTSTPVTVTALSAPTLFFTPGILTTVAGNSKIGYTGDGGSATAATLNQVNGIAVDGAGNLYLADTTNNVVRVVNTQSSTITVAGVSIPAGAIATVAGTGIACAAPTASPACGNGGPATSAQLNLPAYLKLDVAGNIYIADTIDNAVRVVNTQGSAITIAGVTIPAGDIASVVGTGTACAAPAASPACGDGGQASAATLFKPRGVYVDASGNIYVVDNGDYRTRKVTAATGVITTVVGTGTQCASSTLACGDGGQAISAMVASVHGLYVDASGQIYLADDTDNRIRKVNTAGVISTIAGSGTAGTTVNGATATSAAMTNPGDVVVDAAGDVYIAGGNINVVTMVNSAGALNFIAGNVTSVCTNPTATAASSCYGGGDGKSSLAASVFGPQSLAMDAQGNLYIAESGNNDIRKLTVGASAASFSSQAQGTTSAPQTVSVLNTGSQALAVSALSIPAAFTQITVGSDCSSTTNLLPAAACSVGVAFDPPSFTAYSTNAVVTSNSGNAVSGTNLIALTGTGVYVAPTVTLTPTLTFGNQPVGTTSSVQTLTLANTGTSPFTISSIALADTVDYAETNNCPAVLAAQTSCIVSISFSPASTSTIIVTLTITDTPDSVIATSTFTGTGTVAVASLNPALLSFGTQPVGISGSPQTVTLMNTGLAPLNISAIAVSGGNAASFSQTSTCGSSVAAGASCIVSVTLTPTTSGSLSANLTFADNAAGTPQSVALSGTGSVSAPSATLSPLSANFGLVPLGTSATTQTVTLKNGGNQALILSGIVATGSGFSQTNACGAQLAGGASCSISVGFSPVTATVSAGTLSISDNAAGSPQTISLSGTGTAPQAVVTPSSITYGSQSTAAPSSPQTVTLSNPGNATLSISGITIGGVNASSFSETSNCGTSLNGGSTCAINVVFAPAAAGNYSAALSIADSVSGSPQVVALSGTGVMPEPAVTLTPTSLNFGSLPILTTSTSQTVTLRNSGTAALTLSSIAASGSGFVQTNNCGASLTTGSSCTITVTFAPSTATLTTGAITIVDNAGGVPLTTQSVTLTGTGTAPQASFSVSSLNLGTVVPGTSSAVQTVTLSNAGNAALSITSVATGGVSGSSFVDTSLCGTSLAAGSNCVISVTFTPATAGSFSATLTATDNANGASGASQSVTLTAIGTYVGDFTLTATPNTSITATAGQAATFTISVMPLGGAFAGPVTLTVTGLPTGAVAIFTPPSVTPGATGGVTNMFIETQVAELHPMHFGKVAGVILALLLPMLPFKRRLRRRSTATLLLVLLAIAGMAGISGCGTGSTISTPTTQSYSLSVTGTSGIDQHSIPVTLTVNTY